MKKYIPLSISLLFICVLLVLLNCSKTSKDNTIISSRAYSGHESDLDANNFVRIFKHTVATRLDNCQTCHKGGTITYNNEGSPGKTKSINNPCSYCHIKVFENPSNYYDGYPDTYEKTLNNFGLAYKHAGRTEQALREIKDIDSDEDGFTNTDEIAELRFPGDANSKPGQPIAGTIELSFSQVTAMNYHEQFMLMNTTKQQYDEYVLFGGVKIKDFFSQAGIDLTGATGFTVFAPDGYQIDFIFSDFDYFSDSSGFPNSIFYDLRQIQETWPLDQQFVLYPDIIPDGISNGDSLENLHMMIAYKRNGQYLDPSYYDSTDGRINGEGPFRIIRPQYSNDNGDVSNAYRPDRGSKSSSYLDGWDFLGFDYDHNAGDAVKGTCVIRIDPMPKGYEEYDWKNGWDLIQDKKIIIYGHGIH